MNHTDRDRTLVLRVRSPLDQIYSFEDEDGTQYYWNATRGMQLAEARGEVFTFSPAEAGITLAHVRARCPGLNERYAMQTDTTLPLLFVPHRGKALLIDGWHRLFRVVAEGVAEPPAYLLTQEEADRILLCRLPKGRGIDWGQRAPQEGDIRP